MNKSHKGFTLIEMAVVLVIVGLLLSGLLIPLSAQIDQKDYSQAKSQLQEIREALLGYAVINGRLPCPDTTGDGIEDACANTASSSTGGNIPWIDLGIQARDPWQQTYKYRVNGAFTTTFTLATPASVAAAGAGVLQVCIDSTCAATLANNVPAIIYSSGKNGAGVSTSADELENTDNDKDFVSHDFSNSTTSGFDDLVVWISSNVMINRMVTANKLP